jgi:hypothetical protein
MIGLAIVFGGKNLHRAGDLDQLLAIEKAFLKSRRIDDAAFILLGIDAQVTASLPGTGNFGGSDGGHRETHPGVIQPGILNDESALRHTFPS